MLSSVGTMQAYMGQKSDFVACLSKPIKQSQLYNVFVDVFSNQWLSCTLPKSSPSQFDLHLAQLPLRLLLVEDIALNQKVAQQMLQRLGYRTDVVSNGLEALEALSRRDYDVVFMDVQMPQMDGLEATRCILKHLSPRRPWIIAMTAHAMQSDRQECLSAGMNDYISKPIRLEALVQAIDRYKHLRGKGAGESVYPDNFLKQFPPAPLPPSEAGSPASFHPSIDLKVLQDLRDMAGEAAASVLAEIIESYLEDARPRLQAITQAVALSDAVAVQKSAHAFRSLSVTVGAIPVAQLCEALETMGRAGTTVGAQKLLEQLQDEYERLEKTLVCGGFLI